MKPLPAITTEIDNVAVCDFALSGEQMDWLSSNASIASPIPEAGYDPARRARTARPAPAPALTIPT